MHRNDKVKLGVVITLFSIIGVLYFFEGKSQLTKIVVGISAVIWLLTMYFLRKRKK